MRESLSGIYSRKGELKVPKNETKREFLGNPPVEKN